MTTDGAFMNHSRIHGGPGADGPARFDFSTTANACGPCPAALAALREAPYQHYPDPAYTVLREQLAALHRVAPQRLLLAASASEFIFRITAVSSKGPVSVPVHAFGDYAAAARAHGRQVVHTPADASLVWFADPASPTGQGMLLPAEPAGFTPRPHGSPATWTVLDRAGEPLRLEGASAWAGDQADSVFQLYSPNKALGLTGVRGAYAIVPLHSCSLVQRLEATCPSWPLGAAGVALLTAWASPAVQQWLADARTTLRAWKQRQTEGLSELGWRVQPSVTNYFLLHPPASIGMDAEAFAVHVVQPALAAAGVAWRHTASFGLPGAWRVSVQPPAAQDHVWLVLRTLATRS